jgi:integrase
MELEKFQGFMIKTKRVCRKEINRRVKIVQKMWRWAVKEQLTPANRSSYEIQSVDSIPEGKMGTYDYVKIEPVNWDVIELTIEYCERVLGDMILIQWLTGMRPSELCRMTPGAIDRTADVWVYDLKKSYNPDAKEKTENEEKITTRKKKTLKSKTENKGNDRFVYLGPKAQSILQQYLLRPAGEPCFSPRENLALYNASRRKERLAPQHTGWQSKGVSSRIGIAYNAITYRNAIKYVINRANRELRKLKLKEIQDWTPYHIRHSYSTIADEKFDVETSAALCGHGVNVAESTYIKRRKDIAIDAARKIG